LPRDRKIHDFFSLRRGTYMLLKRKKGEILFLLIQVLFGRVKAQSQNCNKGESLKYLEKGDDPEIMLFPSYS
jgi:hypothetical protein